MRHAGADLGCFSFQNSKHIPSGEGGAVTGNSDDLIDRCTAYHNCGRATGGFQGSGCFTRSSNFRMQHFQAAILLQQFDKLVKETKIRQANADYLSTNLKQIPGIAPARLPDASRAVWHPLPVAIRRAAIRRSLRVTGSLRALRAEGVPCSGGYHEQYNDGSMDEAINSRGFKRLFSAAKRLKEYRESFQELKGNSPSLRDNCRLAPDFYFWADRKDMDHVIASGSEDSHARRMRWRKRSRK